MILRKGILFYFSNNQINGNTKDIEIAKKLFGLLNFEGTNIFMKKIDESLLQLERNANPKILFLTLSLTLSKLMKKR